LAAGGTLLTFWLVWAGSGLCILAIKWTVIPDYFTS
jgi:hypothetical protein